MKKLILLIFPLLLLGCTSKEVKMAPKPTITLTKVSAEYASIVKLSDIVIIDNGSLIKDNNIDTLKLGTQKISFKYKDKDNKKYNYSFEFIIKDTTPPNILNRSTYTVKKGTTNLDLVSKIICGDNYDRNLVCTMEGTYNLNTVGEYNLAFTATDSSGNKITNPFALKVIDDTPSYTVPSVTPVEDNDIKFVDFMNNYKNNNTEVGIDVSEWQGDIDWNKVKNAGATFVMIRIGHGTNDDGTYYEDKKFAQNLVGAKTAGLKVGIYYYSKAISSDEAIKQAKWIISVLNGEKLDLPISFDWESWSSFNSFHINYNDLNNTAKSFMDEVIKAGYKGMNYGSVSYLEKIWSLDAYPTWAAHYAKVIDYSKPYYIWQAANTGRIDGINAHVDLDVLNKN